MTQPEGVHLDALTAVKVLAVPFITSRLWKTRQPFRFSKGWSHGLARARTCSCRFDSQNGSQPDCLLKRRGPRCKRISDCKAQSAQGIERISRMAAHAFREFWIIGCYRSASKGTQLLPDSPLLGNNRQRIRNGTAQSGRPYETSQPERKKRGIGEIYPAFLVTGVFARTSKNSTKRTVNTVSIVARHFL